jgi:prepilin-type processing-associated H-X9-DG protein
MFRRETEILNPARTPTFGDATLEAAPRASDQRPVNLREADEILPWERGAMEKFALPRHRRPSPLPKAPSPGVPLPGTVNVSFFDGHVEQLRPDALWQLYWHRDYVPPAK